MHNFYFHVNFWIIFFFIRNNSIFFFSPKLFFLNRFNDSMVVIMGKMSMKVMDLWFELSAVRFLSISNIVQKPFAQQRKIKCMYNFSSLTFVTNCCFILYIINLLMLLSILSFEIPVLGKIKIKMKYWDKISTVIALWEPIVREISNVFTRSAFLRQTFAVAIGATCDKSVINALLVLKTKLPPRVRAISKNWNDQRHSSNRVLIDI